MKVFVTGGSGYVGRNLIPYLLDHGDSVVALSRSDTADKLIREASASSEKVTIFRSDIAEPPEKIAKGKPSC